MFYYRKTPMYLETDYIAHYDDCVNICTALNDKKYNGAEILSLFKQYKIPYSGDIDETDISKYTFIPGDYIINYDRYLKIKLTCEEKITVNSLCDKCKHAEYCKFVMAVDKWFKALPESPFPELVSVNFKCVNRDIKPYKHGDDCCIEGDIYENIMQ